MADSLQTWVGRNRPRACRAQPTPFLIRRAVNWGAMSQPEVIAEIIGEEGDVSRLFNVLGVKM